MNSRFKQRDNIKKEVLGFWFIIYKKGRRVIKEAGQVRLKVINVSFLLLSFSQFALMEDTNITFICFLSWAWAYYHGQQRAHNKVNKAITTENKTRSNLNDFLLFCIFVCTFNTKWSHIYVLSFRSMIMNRKSHHNHNNRENKHTVSIVTIW